MRHVVAEWVHRYHEVRVILLEAFSEAAVACQVRQELGPSPGIRSREVIEEVDNLNSQKRAASDIFVALDLMNSVLLIWVK